MRRGNLCEKLQNIVMQISTPMRPKGDEAKQSDEINSRKARTGFINHFSTRTHTNSAAIQ